MKDCHHLAKFSGLHCPECASERVAELVARAKELAQSPATRNGPEIHAVCGEAARIRFMLKHGEVV